MLAGVEPGDLADVTGNGLVDLSDERTFEDRHVVAGIGEDVGLLLQRPEDVGARGSEIKLGVVALK